MLITLALKMITWKEDYSEFEASIFHIVRNRITGIKYKTHFKTKFSLVTAQQCQCMISQFILKLHLEC